MNTSTFGNYTIEYCGACGKPKNFTGAYEGSLPSATSIGSPWCQCPPKQVVEPSNNQDGSITIKGPLVFPETTKHDGNLDDGDIDSGHAAVILSHRCGGIIIDVQYQRQRIGSVYLDANQALSLLSWLKQEETTLTKFAEKDND